MSVAGKDIFQFSIQPYFFLWFSNIAYCYHYGFEMKGGQTGFSYNVKKRKGAESTLNAGFEKANKGFASILGKLPP